MKVLNFESTDGRLILSLNFFLPRITIHKFIKTDFGDSYSETNISFPTVFRIVRSNSHYMGMIRLLGFGFRFKVTGLDNERT